MYTYNEQAQIILALFETRQIISEEERPGKGAKRVHWNAKPYKKYLMKRWRKKRDIMNLVGFSLKFYDVKLSKSQRKKEFANFVNSGEADFSLLSWDLIKEHITITDGIVEIVSDLNSTDIMMLLLKY